MTVGELKAFLANFADHVPVKFADPNFGGELGDEYAEPSTETFTYERGAVLIAFPAVPPLGD